MVLKRVRQATAPLHKAVEQKLQLASPELTFAHYTRVLQAFLGFFEPWEAALDAACPEEFRPLWSNSARAERLRTDLRSLGAAPDPHIASPAVPPIENPGAWLGSLYVLEGSRLGGQHISRHVEQHFHWADGRGYSFFATNPLELRQRWRTLCTAIESHNNLSNQIVRGSHRTFDCLLKHFNVAL